MKRPIRLLALLLIGVLLLSSCSSLVILDSKGSSSKAPDAESPSQETTAGASAFVSTPAATNAPTPTETTAQSPSSGVNGETQREPSQSEPSSTAPDSSQPSESETSSMIDIVLPLPEDAFSSGDQQSVIGSIVQIGDGNAYVNGTVPAPPRASVMSLRSRAIESTGLNDHLVTFEHSFGLSCFVSGYIGNDLYIIQDFGSLAQNRKGIGHMDGTPLIDFNDNGYFSISSMYENKIIVGNPTDESIDSLWGDTSSYLFGYLIYNEESRELVPMYEENNLRFYTAGYFMNGVAVVSVKEGDKILFGAIDAEGNYVIEPKYEMLADESSNGLYIVALEATHYSGNNEIASPEEDPTPYARIYRDTCGRSISYSSTLMTNVQSIRSYECTSQTVGLVNIATGEYLLECNYAYITKLTDSVYFVIDNDGNKFLYDATENTLTSTGSVSYFYFNSLWLLCVDGDNVYLADKEFNVYDASEFDLSNALSDTIKKLSECVNTNVISSSRDELAKAITTRKRERNHFIESNYNRETMTRDLTVVATGDVIEDVITYTEIYNGSFLYTVSNNLYRYDIDTAKSVRIETGYGNYTEDYDNIGAYFYASVGRLDDGIYILRYNIQYIDGGTGYHMIIVSDKGVVLYEASVNEIVTLDKNYLGEYDDALYDMAGGTAIEDNFFLTRTDGAHFLISFVRGEFEEGANESDTADTTRVIDSSWTFSLISPFTLDFTDGSDIEVTLQGKTVSPQFYAYDSETQSLKFFRIVFDIDHDLYMTLIEQRFLEFVVTSGEETAILRIEISPFAYEF